MKKYCQRLPHPFPHAPFIPTLSSQGLPSPQAFMLQKLPATALGVVQTTSSTHAPVLPQYTSHGPARVKIKI